MVKIYSQNIKPARYYYYTAYLTEAFDPGFNFYLDPYPYTSTMIVKKRINFKLPHRSGFDPIKIGVPAARSRTVIKRIADIWELQAKHTGVEPPFTGPRARDWWYANTPEYQDDYYRWFVQQSMWFVNYYRKPPWAIQPFMWIADTGNHRITSRNVNDFSYISKYGSQGSGNDQLQDPKSITVDDTYLYIADSGNSRIMIRNKLTLEFVTKVTSFGTPPNSFIEPVDICFDDNYLYIADKGYPYIIILNKSDYSFFGGLDLKVEPDETNFVPVSVKVNYYYIYVVDSHNLRLKIFDRNTLVKRFWTNSKYDKTVQLIDPHYISLSSWYIFLADTGNNRILQLSIYYPSIFLEIGPGKGIDVNLSGPQGVTISGDYLMITDTGNHRLARLTLNPTEFDQFFGTQGSGDLQLESPANIDAEPQHYFTPY